MDLNFTNIYSSLASQSNKPADQDEKIIQELEKLEELPSAAAAKKYLSEKFGIDETRYRYVIGNDIVLTIVENSESYCAKFAYKDERLSYSYEK